MHVCQTDHIPAAAFQDTDVMKSLYCQAITHRVITYGAGVPLLLKGIPLSATEINLRACVYVRVCERHHRTLPHVSAAPL